MSDVIQWLLDSDEPWTRYRADKKKPSAWLTFLVLRILKRTRP